MRLHWLDPASLQGPGERTRRTCDQVTSCGGCHDAARCDTQRKICLYFFFPEVCQLCGSSFKLNVWLHITNCLHTLEVLAKLKGVIARVVMCLAEHSSMHVGTDTMYLYRLTLALFSFFSKVPRPGFFELH